MKYISYYTGMKQLGFPLCTLIIFSLIQTCFAFNLDMDTTQRKEIWVGLGIYILLVTFLSHSPEVVHARQSPELLLLISMHRVHQSTNRLSDSLKVTELVSAETQFGPHQVVPSLPPLMISP